MRVLAVSGSERSLDGLLALIKEGGIDADSCSSGAEARRRVLDEEWDEVVINYPLSDESGLELARMIQNETSIQVVMLIRSEDMVMIGDELQKAGVITVEKPIIRPVFIQALHLALSIRQRLMLADARIKRLERRIEDMRLESKAKCLLSLRRGMSEEQGHREIEKMAMDMRITLRQAAAMILREESDV